MVVHTSYTN
uniref:Uncharacterized protein n=1 Tax=Arundo donax TaxID=35708 RepID=A0A0A9A5A9_ARUDO